MGHRENKHIYYLITHKGID